MKLVAKEVVQNGTKFYLTSIPAEEVIDESLFLPDRWNPVTNEGYQREPSKEYARRIQFFISGEGGTNVLPTNVIINSRKPLKINRIANGMVEIDLETRDFPLTIIDGQHRIMALRNAIADGSADLDHYELGVTLTNFSIQDEIVHFRNINGRANKSPKALNDLLMGKLADEYGITPQTIEEQATIRANRVVLRLATDPESPWYNHIALGGMRRRSFHLSVQSSIATSMRTMFSSGRFSDPDENPDKIYQIFKSWWVSLAEVWPDAFENPESYVFMRQGGFYVWHRVLARVLTNANFNPTQAQMYEALNGLREKTGWDDEFFRMGNRQGAQSMVGGGVRGQVATSGVLTDVIWRELPKDPLRVKEEVVESGL
jgi:DGQHR domain-containing protein